MKYKIIRENKPTLKNYGRYKAVAMHFQTISPEEVEQEIEDNCSAKSSDVKLVLNELSQVLQRHLKQGDRVRLEGLGLLKLEIESEKVARSATSAVCASTSCPSAAKVRRLFIKTYASRSGRNKKCGIVGP